MLRASLWLADFVDEVASTLSAAGLFVVGAASARRSEELIGDGVRSDPRRLARPQLRRTRPMGIWKGSPGPDRLDAHKDVPLRSSGSSKSKSKSQLSRGRGPGRSAATRNGSL